MKPVTLSGEQRSLALPLSAIGTGWIYRNSAPHLYARHAWYPSVVALPDTSLLATFVVGSAMESLDCSVHLARSVDGGRTWSHEGPLHRKAADCTETCRVTQLRDGRLLILLSESLRMDPDSGATNPETLGHVPTRMSILQSNDRGVTWSAPQPLTPPIESPSFELCSPIVELDDGRLVLPTSTWRGWDGSAPNGMKAVAFISEDGGNSWPRSVDVMNGCNDRVLFWEQKIAEIDHDRLLAIAWAYKEDSRSDLANHIAIANKRTLEFTAPKSIPLHGQTPSLLHLGEGRVLCVYRRTDEPGLYACLAHLDSSGHWDTIAQLALWKPAMVPAASNGAVLVEHFRALKCGAPCVLKLSNHEVLVAFWCVEDCVAGIRWISLNVRSD